MSEGNLSRVKVIDALESWILRVVDNKANATPEELAALPDVARVWLECTAPAIKILPRTATSSV